VDVIARIGVFVPAEPHSPRDACYVYMYLLSVDKPRHRYKLYVDKAGDYGEKLKVCSHFIGLLGNI